VRKSVVILLAIGLLQMVGDLLHVAPLKGFAAATAASPAPKVFSSVRGLETYSIFCRVDGYRCAVPFR
jgi:hypothetical protein